MQTSDFFRGRIDAMINLNDPLAVLATRLPWDQIEAALAPMFTRQDRPGVTSSDLDLFGAVTDANGDPYSDGLAVWLAGRKLLAVCATFAVAEHEGGRAYFNRRDQVGARLLWEINR